MAGREVKQISVLLAILGVAAAGLLWSACPPSSDAPVVGVILASSGPADFIGKPERAVLEALEDDEEFRTFRLRFADSAGSPGQAADLFEEFAKDPSVVAVIGPSTSGEALRLAGDADDIRLPMLTLAASADIVKSESGDARPFVFKFAQNDSLAAERLATTMRTLGIQDVALLYSADGFGKSGATQFRAVLDSLGTPQLVHDAPFEPSLAQGAATVAALPEMVDAVLVWGTAPAPAVIVKTLRQQRPDVGVFLSHGNASLSFIESAGAAADGAILVGSRVLLDASMLDAGDAADDVVAQYQKFWGANFQGPPSHFGGHARDAYEALVRCVPDSANAKGAAGRVAIRDCLEATSQLHGVTGTFSFSKSDHAGLSVDAFATYRIENQKFVQYSIP